jgi:hypothetical protein
MPLMCGKSGVGTSRHRRIGEVCSGVIRDRVEPAVSPAMSAMPLKAEVNSEY